MILVVSPHLDDAALSLPAWISTHTAVTVLTVFSEGVPAIRRAEDQRALALLGADLLHLGLLDAPLRRSIPQDFDHLVLAPLAPDDTDAAAIIHTLTTRIHQIAPTTVLLPLGVGEHIDHRIVHAAHTTLSTRVGFYADRPYATIRHATRARLARLGASIDGTTVSPSRTAADNFLTAARLAPHLRVYLPGPDREPRLNTLAAPLLQPAPPSGLHLQYEHHRFTPAQRTLAARAVSSYTSQIPDLFGSHDALREAFNEPYIERIYWRAR